MSSFFIAVAALTRREVVRFLRQRNRVVGALATPLVFWFLIGSGVGKSFSGSNGGGVNTAGVAGSYLHYFFPGTLLLIILFTAIFSTISIIEDRREGFLQGVLVSPVSRAAFVLAKLLGGTLLSLLQCLLLYGLAVAMGLPATVGGFLLFLASVTALGLGLTALGYLIAWPLDSTQGFHALMNLLLMPLWFLSGALFPPGGAAGWLRAVMAVNPLTYGLNLLRAALNPGGSTAGLPTAMGITVLFAFILGWACVLFTEKKGARHP